MAEINRLDVSKDELDVVCWLRDNPKLLKGLVIAKYTFKDEMIGNIVLNFKCKGQFAKYDLHIFPQ
jgi:hypothetical protein